MPKQFSFHARLATRQSRFNAFHKLVTEYATGTTMLPNKTTSRGRHVNLAERFRRLNATVLSRYAIFAAALTNIR